MKKLVVFASGSGSNFKSIIDAAEEGRLDSTISGLIASRDQIGAIEIARKHDIPWKVIKPSDFDDEQTFGAALLHQLDQWNPDLIALAGYLCKIPEEVISHYPARILNIHPSLLPRHGGKGLYGHRVHQSVIDSGDRTSGCTVHLVNEVYDDGPILAQREVPVLKGDTAETLAKRVLKEEHDLYPKVINTFLKQKP